MAGAGITVAPKATDVDRLDTASAGSAVFSGDTPALLTVAAPLASIPLVADPDTAPATLPSIPMAPAGPAASYVPAFEGPIFISKKASEIDSACTAWYRDLQSTRILSEYQLQKLTLIFRQLTIQIYDLARKSTATVPTLPSVPDNHQAITARYFEALVQGLEEVLDSKGKYSSALNTLRQKLAHNQARIANNNKAIQLALLSSYSSLKSNVLSLFQTARPTTFPTDADRMPIVKYLPNTALRDVGKSSAVFLNEMKALISKLASIKTDPEAADAGIISAKNAQIRLLLIDAGKLAGDYMHQFGKGRDEYHSHGKITSFMNAVREHRNEISHDVMGQSKASIKKMFIETEQMHKMHSLACQAASTYVRVPMHSYLDAEAPASPVPMTPTAVAPAPKTDARIAAEVKTLRAYTALKLQDCKTDIERQQAAIDEHTKSCKKYAQDPSRLKTYGSNDTKLIWENEKKKHSDIVRAAIKKLIELNTVDLNHQLQSICEDASLSMADKHSSLNAKLAVFKTDVKSTVAKVEKALKAFKHAKSDIRDKISDDKKAKKAKKAEKAEKHNRVAEVSAADSERGPRKRRCGAVPDEEAYPELAPKPPASAGAGQGVSADVPKPVALAAIDNMFSVSLNMFGASKSGIRKGKGKTKKRNEFGELIK